MKRLTFVAGIFLMLLSLAGSATWAGETARMFDKASWSEVLKTRKGQPLIVHFWGLTCPICIVELKDWGKFAAEHPGTAIVLVNWDRRPEKPKRINAALKKAGLGNLPSLALADGYEEKLRFAVDHDWMGELPYTRLIGRDGKVTTFSGSADFHTLTEWVAKEKK
jgi:thiol-disulfide isomerase/thioredoxin